MPFEWYMMIICIILTIIAIIQENLLDKRWKKWKNINEKKQKQRFWNDWEEDTYEDII